MKKIMALLMMLAMLAGSCALADMQAEMLINAAVSELGYTATKGGYSKYGEWGGKAYGEWCSEFVSWCVARADEVYGSSMLGSDYPLQTSCADGAAWFKERGSPGRCHRTACLLRFSKTNVSVKPISDLQ